MPNDPTSPAFVWTIVQTVLLVAGLFLLGLIHHALRRILRILRGAAANGDAAVTQEDARRSSQSLETQGAFAAFLAEDPSRSSLPKREQAALFRDWRKSQGMTWKNS